MISNTLPQSLIDNPILSQWIAFEEPGRVRVGTGKVEIGQGILTALTQIAAEELDVGPTRCGLVSGQTDVSPAEGFTSGSYSIAVGGASIRLVCAEVRSLFLDRARRDAAAARSASCRSRTDKFLRAGKDTGRDYWSIAGEVELERRASGTAPIKRAVDLSRSSARSLPRARPAGEGHGRGVHPRHRAGGRACTRACCGSPGAARVSSRSTRTPCARPPRRRSTSCARATSSPSRRRARLAVMRAAEAARTLARWDGGDAGARRHRRAGLAQGAARRATARSRPGMPAAPPRAAWSRRATRGRS